jgi:hypothetical protein
MNFALEMGPLHLVPASETVLVHDPVSKARWHVRRKGCLKAGITIIQMGFASRKAQFGWPAN